MANPQQTPWAVLLCRFKDTLSDPPDMKPNFRSLCQKFFTPQPAYGTFNAVQFFQDVSHGSLDLSGSQVFPSSGWFTLDANLNDLVAPTDPPPPGWQPKISRDSMMALAKKTASDQGVPLGNFLGGVTLVFNRAVGGSQGGSWGGIPPNVGVFSDYRYVQNNGTESYGQEMGHAYGLDHSRSDDPKINLLGCDPSTLDYRDPWDGMSTACAYFAPDPDFGARGPGFNAWNMRGRRWLDESRVWRGTANPFDQVVQLSPLHRHDLPGLLAAELPPIDGHYLVEFRIKDRWDAAIPRSAVLVHRFEGIIGQFLGAHSYIMSGTNGNQDLAEGDTLNATASGLLEVFAVDTPAGSAWHTKQLTSSSSFGDWSRLGDAAGLGPIAVISGINGGLEVFAVDTGAGFVWTNWQNGPNGDFEGWVTVGNKTGFRQVTAGRNADGRLEVFAFDKTGQAWHTAQPDTSSGFPDWSRLGSGVTVDHITVARNADVAIHVEVLKIDEQGQTATLRLSSSPIS